MAEDRNFMWDNLPGSRGRKAPLSPLTTEEAESLGSKIKKSKDETEEEDQTQENEEA